MINSLLSKLKTGLIENEIYIFFSNLISNDFAIFITIGSTIFSAICTWFFSRWYYQRSSRDLRKIILEKHNDIEDLIVDGYKLNQDKIDKMFEIAFDREDQELYHTAEFLNSLYKLISDGDNVAFIEMRYQDCLTFAKNIEFLIWALLNFKDVSIKKCLIELLFIKLHEIYNLFKNVERSTIL